MMCLGVGFFASIFVWDSLYFLDFHIYFLYQIREVFFHSVFKSISNFLLFLFSFWHPYNVNVGLLEVVPEDPNTILVFWIFFFLLVPIGCFLLPYVPNHRFDSWLHPLYCCFPVNCPLFQLVYH